MRSRTQFWPGRRVWCLDRSVGARHCQYCIASQSCIGIVCCVARCFLALSDVRTLNVFDESGDLDAALSLDRRSSGWVHSRAQSSPRSSMSCFSARPASRSTDPPLPSPRPLRCLALLSHGSSSSNYASSSCAAHCVCVYHQHLYIGTGSLTHALSCE